MPNNAYNCDLDILTANDDGVASAPRSLIAIHTFEGRDLTAREMAEYQLSPDAGGSYHIVIDADGVTARENDDAYIPWSAAWTGNRRAFHISLAGQAAFSTDTWLARTAQLDKLAEVVAAYAGHYGIPLIKRGHVELQEGKWGICGHADISLAWNESDHTDPGNNFPFGHVIRAAENILSGPSPVHAKSSTPGPKTFRSYVDGAPLPLHDYVRFIDEKVTRLYDHFTPEGAELAVPIDTDAEGKTYPSFIDTSKSFTIDQYIRLIDYKIDRLKNEALQ